ncbi:MAG: copper amine oxidase N-terminal domain-containing protein [Bacillota bacterium]
MIKNHIIKCLFKQGATLLLFCLLFTNAALAINPQPEPPGIQVAIDGSPLSMDTAPLIVQGRTLVPLRAIFEALGATVEWNQVEQSVTAVKGDVTLYLKIGSINAKRNNAQVTLDVPAQIVNSCTLVPLRFIGEALGAQVSWDGEKRKVSIVSADAAASTAPGITLPGDIQTGSGLSLGTSQFTGMYKVSDRPAGVNLAASPTNPPDLSHRANSYNFQPISDTELLVSALTGKPTGSSAHKYVKGDGVFIDWSLTDQKWWFKWAGGPLQNWYKPESVVTSVVWQVSLFPFLGDGTDWRNPPGLLASGRFSAAEKEFSIDFASFLAGQSEVNAYRLDKITVPLIEKALSSALQQQNLSEFVRERYQTALRFTTYLINRTDSSGQMTLVNPNIALNPGKQDNDCPTCVSAANLDMKQLTATLPGVSSRKYYVRVVLLNSQDKCVGTPSAASGSRVRTTADNAFRRF